MENEREAKERTTCDERQFIVARAYAANTLAVAIPCQCAVKSDGALSDYRWGVEGKGALLKRKERRRIKTA